MKPFAIWLAIVAIVFGGYALISSSLQETSRVFVVVDTSNSMAAFDDEIRRELDRIDDRDDAEFALANVSNQPSNSGLVHTWQSQLRWNSEQRFGRCSFDDIESFAEAADADDRIVLTTADCDTSALVDWEIILLEP